MRALHVSRFELFERSKDSKGRVEVLGPVDYAARSAAGSERSRSVGQED